MTKMLEQAFSKASSLPDEVQDAVAQSLLRELAWESSWDGTLEANQDGMEVMALKALEAFKQGKTQELGFDDL